MQSKYIYSGTSNKRPSEKGTTSLQRTLLNAPNYTTMQINLREEDNLSTKDKIAGPNVSSIRKFLCIMYVCTCFMPYLLFLALWLAGMYHWYRLRKAYEDEAFRWRKLFIYNLSGV